MSPQSLDILYEDQHVLVCVKPSGTATQSKSVRSPDMESLIKNHLKTAGSHGRTKQPSGKASSGEPYLAVIHRLDQPVKGIMVFAKTPFAAKELNRELQNGGFGKYYRALVFPAPPEPRGILEDYMVKDAKTNASRICRKETPGAKAAKLAYETVPESQRYFPLSREASQDPAPAELDIHLYTGRHHQIRVQLAHIGCPIVGDTKYNPKASGQTGWQELKLCSYRLEFTHPKTKKRMEFCLLS